MARDEMRWRLEVEEFEDRLTPATLTVTPPSFAFADGSVRFITNSAQPGLTTAQLHTAGVVMWSLPDPG